MKLAMSHDPVFGEVREGRSIYPNSDGTWDLLEDDEFLIKAGVLRHTIPCVGFVIKEKDKPG